MEAVSSDFENFDFRSKLFFVSLKFLFIFSFVRQQFSFQNGLEIFVYFEVSFGDGKTKT